MAALLYAYRQGGFFSLGSGGFSVLFKDSFEKKKRERVLGSFCCAA